MNGLVVIDKPAGGTSRDAVNCLQRTLGRGMKLGHTGTLDPLATGVLVVCVGHATRLADYVQAMGKSYSATIRLGATSTTDDADGDVTLREEIEPIDRKTVDAALTNFRGAIEQLPPQYSAILVNGVRAHELARGGADFALKPRPVTVHRLEVIEYAWPNLHLEIDCSKGTYIRSIARDLGATLGCGGYITALRRTSVGPFLVEQGIYPTADRRLIASRMYPMTTALGAMPLRTMTGEERIRINRGQKIAGTETGRVGLVAAGGDLAALAEGDGAELQPVLVFAG